MRKTFLCALLVLGCSLAVFAQDVNEVDPGNLTKGVSATKARAMLLASEQAADREAKALRAKRDGLLRQISAITAGARAALKRELEADKTGTYQNYLADVRQLGKMQGKERGNALRELESKYQVFFEAAYKRANINEADLKTKLLRVMPGAKFGPFLTMTGRDPEGPDDDETVAAHAVPQDDQTFEAPYGVRSTKEFAQGISYSDTTATASKDDGRIISHVTVSMIVGNGEARAAVGQAFDAPASVKKVRGTTETDSDYYMDAVGVVAVSGTWVDQSIVIDKPNGKHKTRTHNFGWVVAPVGWHAHLEGEDEPLSISRTVLNPSGGGTYQIKARVITNAYCYGLFGLGYGSGGATLKKITVHFTH